MVRLMACQLRLGYFQLYTMQTMISQSNLLAIMSQGLLEDGSQSWDKLDNNDNNS